MKSGCFKLNVRLIFEFSVCIRFKKIDISCDLGFSEVTPLRPKVEDRADVM